MDRDSKLIFTIAPNLHMSLYERLVLRRKQSPISNNHMGVPMKVNNLLNIELFMSCLVNNRKTELHHIDKNKPNIHVQNKPLKNNS